MACTSHTSSKSGSGPSQDGISAKGNSIAVGLSACGGDGSTIDSSGTARIGDQAGKCSSNTTHNTTKCGNCGGVYI